MPQNTTFFRKSRGPKNLAWYASTLFGLGFFSAMPGTVGSAAGFLAFALFPVPWYAIVAVAGLAVWASEKHSREVGDHDPAEVILDEVVGTWAAMYGLPPGFSLPALFLFRIVDIIKPFPVNASERLPGGWGIVADDLVGGVMVNLILSGIQWLYFGGGWSVIF